MTIDFPPDDPRGRELRLLLERLKYERHLASEADAILEAAFNRVLDLMLSGEFRSLTQFQRQRAAQLFRELEKRIHAGYRDLTTLHIDAMKGYAQLEAEVARETVSSLLAGSEISTRFGAFLPKNFLTSIAKLPIQGLNIGEWFDAQAKTMSLEVRRIIQQGLIEGKGTAAIASRILASDKAAGPVLSRRAKAQARTISRTVVNAVQNSAQMASLEALPEDVSDSYMWVSVRDSRTSLTCIGLDGRVWRYDDPKRRIPPAHPSCRSSIRSLLKGIDNTLASQKVPPTMRGYDSWLKQQTVTEQNSILGPTRAGWWREGKMSLADAVDGDTRVLTLKELRARLGLGALAGVS